jgi:hypothetical protein
MHVTALTIICQDSEMVCGWRPTRQAGVSRCVLETNAVCKIPLPSFFVLTWEGRHGKVLKHRNQFASRAQQEEAYRSSQ